ncbi:MAG: hypothetical protein GY874_14870 [Desulfobacteraceae bacterium]|nr:hypothetical protein [Desulfobacteraceae bacterium]
MFCPQCKTEYRDGFSTCSDCGESLVASLPEDPDTQFVDYEEIMRTYNPADIAIIKSILDAENITYYFQGEHLVLRPMGDAAKLMVAKQDAENVRELISDLNFSYTETSARTEENNEKNNGENDE